MGGYEVKFNVYADSQEEADVASALIKRFITEQAAKGVAVTAKKISEAVGRWRDSYFVSSYFKQ